MSIFAFSLPRQGVAVPLSTYAGKVTLIVNTASRCSFTAANLETLNALQRAYEPRGFSVLGCPSADFARQEPLSNEALATWRGEMGLAFPLFDKVQVKGKDVDPLFAMLQERLGKARWNYTKFLCDRAGTPVRRFDAGCPPQTLHEAVESLL